MPIADLHEDIAYNVLAEGRDYLSGNSAIRARERGTDIEKRAGRAMLGLPEWREGGVGLIGATLFVPPRRFARQGEPSYVHPSGAYELARAQLAVYERWERESGAVRILRSRLDLEELLAQHRTNDSTDAPIGLVLIMENAEPVRTPDDVALFWELGVRIIGPAWKRNRYAGGTGEPGPLTADGRELLARMRDAGLILDMTHFADQAAADALKVFDGPILASHANSRRTLNSDRQLPDFVLQEIGRRGGVAGQLLASWGLSSEGGQARPGTEAGSGSGEYVPVSLAAAAAAAHTVIDVSGRSDTIALGSDFDGGFGSELAPAEMDTVADMRKLRGFFSGAGFSDAEIEGYLWGNAIRFLRRALP